MNPLTNAQPRRLVSPALLCLGLLCLAGLAHAVVNAGQRYTGRVLFRGTKSAAVGVLVEAVEAGDDGKPTDEVLGSARAEAGGHFTVVLTKGTNGPVALVVAAVQISAETGGDRRQEGYDLKTHRTLLGFLPNPSPTKPNTLLINPNRPRHSDE